MHRGSLRRILLWMFLLFLGVTAAVAIAVLVFAELDRTMGRVLGTTATVSVGSVLALACAAFREREKIAGTLGIALAALASALSVGLLWSDVVEEDYGRATLLVVTYALSVAHAELMLLARLPSTFRWVQRVLVALIVALALLLTPAIYGYFDDHEPMARLLGVLAILIALGTLAVPVLLWIGRSEIDAAAYSGERGSMRTAKPPRRLLLVEQTDGSWRADDGASYVVQRRE